MPVRIKQRTTSAELVREDEKQLETLRKKIVAMLLAWQNPVSVTLKSPESSKKLNIRGKDVSTVSSKSGNRKLDVTLICSVLSQAGIIEPSDWDSWVRTSARIAWVTVKGVVSLQPAPSKQAQFMSIGIRPISSEMGNNIFYDEINRLFASSTFGYEEDIFDAEDDNRTGKSSRFKKDGITNKQWKGGGKGVDRWPMFYIRIDIQNTKLFPQDEVDMLGEGTISSLIKVLGAMITSFLEENHFSPRVKLGRRKQERSTKPVAIERSQVSRYRGSTLLGSEAAHYIHAEQNFGTWSRIKMGKGSKSSGASPSLSSPDCRAKCELSTVKTLPENSMRTLQDLEASSAEVNDQIVHHNDEQRLEWRNPISGATILVNARTGLVIPPRPLQRPATAPSAHSPSALYFPRTMAVHGSYSHGKVTRSLSTPSTTRKEGSWSSELLKKWENPIFGTTEEGIPQVSFDGPTIEMCDVLHGRHHCCSELEIHKAFMQASTSFSAKISKQSLNTARVISQVDKKFILICVNGSSDTYDGRDGGLLVLVDQHAADERIRVEGLLADLKAGPAVLPKPLTFEVQAREQPVLSRLAPSFAALGIVYDLSTPVGRHSKWKITVTALPAAIAERCRLEPKLLIELIRRESWKCEEESGSLDTRTCPQGLLDMLNSRACRSAVMFNDELTKEECQTLVQRLGNCAFPFQCAHGRPSMVPLVDMGVGASSDVGKQGLGFWKIGLDAGNKETGFAAAWGAWKTDT